MSLKAFHIVFISASTLLAFGFAGWLFKDYTRTGETSDLLYGVGAVGVGIGLIIYGKYFLKKLKRISYL